ncbi:MAG: substrate-binding domain-containing protein, partial [Spirochaetales bacterium]|nr:substrate-binding domain-containing protein [Spirochaetales bacterium]
MGNAKKRYTIGVFIDSFMGSYQGNLILGAHEEAQRHGVSLLYFFSKNLSTYFVSFDYQHNLVYRLAGKPNVDAILMASALLSCIVGKEAFTDFCRFYGDIPFVSIGMEMEGRHSILVDNSDGIRRIVGLLAKVHGRKRILFIRGIGNNWESIERFAGYREALSRHGLPFDPLLVLDGNFQQHTAKASVERHIAERGLDFDAVVASNDDMAIGAASALKARGVNVPEEISVTGFFSMSILSIYYFSHFKRSSRPFS